MPVVIKRPSPALVVAALALFLALVGSGFAATSGHVAAHKRKPKHIAALTAAGVDKLIGAYLRHHRITGRRGATGRTGATGAAGQTGAQGPGAKQIAVFIHGPRTPFPIATIGPWTVRMDCTVGVSANITGPGSFFATTNTGMPGVGALAAETATTKVQTSPLGASGFTVNTTNGSGMSQQVSTDVQLISGSTMEELHLQLTANPVSGDPNSDCSVTGSATPVT
jgi:hypothetical protein